LGFVDQVTPVRWQWNRRRSDRHWRQRRGSPRETSPAPIFRALDEIGAERVALDVAHDRQQVVVLLNQKRPVSTLPDVARRSVLGVIPANVGGEQPARPRTKVVVGSRSDHEMKMIGHQASRENRYLDALLRPMDGGEELRVVILVVKDPRFLIAAIDDVVAAARVDESPCPWHHRSMAHLPRPLPLLKAPDTRSFSVTVPFC
jgi:hypothetical protein